MRAREHCSRKIIFRLWNDLWNTSKLECGCQWTEDFPQNDVLFPHIGTYKAISPRFDTLILQSVAILRLKHSQNIAEAQILPILARGRIVQNSMSARETFTFGVEDNCQKNNK